MKGTVSGSIHLLHRFKTGRILLLFSKFLIMESKDMVFFSMPKHCCSNSSCILLFESIIKPVLVFKFFISPESLYFLLIYFVINSSELKKIILLFSVR